MQVFFLLIFTKGANISVYYIYTNIKLFFKEIVHPMFTPLFTDPQAFKRKKGGINDVLLSVNRG